MNATGNAGNITYRGIQYACELCPAGMACDGVGLIGPTGSCGAGFFCKTGAPSFQPHCDTSQCSSMYGICPIGHYCPAESTGL